MTGEQARAARELLGWSRMRLSVRAGVPEGAITEFEKSGVMQAAMHHSADRVDAVRSTFEAAGVVFAPDGHISLKRPVDGGIDAAASSIGRRRARIAFHGTLQPGVLADLVALRNFLDGRDRALEDLLGEKLARSHLRDELIRMVVIEFGFGRLQSAEHYQDACAHLGDAASVWNELQLLADCGLVLLMPGEADRPGPSVGPSQRLVDWYSTQLPRLMDEVQQFITAREASR